MTTTPSTEALASFGAEVHRILSTVESETGLMDALVEAASGSSLPIYAPDDDENPYVTKPETFTAYGIPAMVWVEVNDNTGRITRVTCDDNEVLEVNPTVVVRHRPVGSGWNTRHHQEVTDADLVAYADATDAGEDGKGTWPAWEFGW